MKGTYRICCLTGVALGSVLAAGIQAQSPAVTSAVATPARKATRWVKAVGDLYSYKETPQGTIHRYQGNVVFTSEDTRLTTELATFNKETQIANSPGKLKIEDTNNSIVGNTGTAYYKTRDAKIRGNVTIVAKPRPEDQTAPEGSARRQFDAPATVTCDNVDYNWRTRIAVATGNMTMKQKDRTVTADRAIVDGRQEKVTLDGNVVLTRPNGERGTATKVVIIYKKGAEEFIATGRVEANFSVEDEEEQPPPSDTPAQDTPPATAPPPGESPPTPPAPKPDAPNTPKP